MNTSKAAVAVVGAIGMALVSTLGVVLTGVAPASSSDERTNIQGTLAHTPATVERDGASFYDVEALARAWSVTVAAFEEDLPASYQIVAELPTEFEALTPGENLFQAQIVDMAIATRYRCSWLDAGFNTAATDDQVEKALKNYWTLPSVAQFDQTGLDTDLETISAELGYKDPNHALFDLTCNGWEKQE